MPSYLRKLYSLHISVGFCVARFDGWAMRRPQTVGRVTGTDSHVFSFYINIHSFGESTRIYVGLEQSLLMFL